MLELSSILPGWAESKLDFWLPPKYYSRNTAYLSASQDTNLKVPCSQLHYADSTCLTSPFLPILLVLIGQPWTVYFQGLVKNTNFTYLFPVHSLGRKQIGKTELWVHSLGYFPIWLVFFWTLWGLDDFLTIQIKTGVLLIWQRLCSTMSFYEAAVC